MVGVGRPEVNQHKTDQNNEMKNNGMELAIDSAQRKLLIEHPWQPEVS